MERQWYDVSSPPRLRSAPSSTPLRSAGPLRGTGPNLLPNAGSRTPISGPPFVDPTHAQCAFCDRLVPPVNPPGPSRKDEDPRADRVNDPVIPHIMNTGGLAKPLGRPPSGVVVFGRGPDQDQKRHANDPNDQLGVKVALSSDLSTASSRASSSASSVRGGCLTDRSLIGSTSNVLRPATACGRSRPSRRRRARHPRAWRTAATLRGRPRCLLAPPRDPCPRPVGAPSRQRA